MAPKNEELHVTLYSQYKAAPPARLNPTIVCKGMTEPSIAALEDSCPCRSRGYVVLAA